MSLHWTSRVQIFPKICVHIHHPFGTTFLQKQMILLKNIRAIAEIDLQTLEMNYSMQELL